MDQCPVEFLKYSKGFNELNSSLMFQKTDDRVLSVYYFYGASGTGKTRTAYEQGGLLYPNGRASIYSKDNSKWFSNYCGEPILLLDDFVYDSWDRALCLRMLDRFPVQVETKGSHVSAQWTTVFITSNFPPPTHDEAFMRRVTTVRDFNVEPYTEVLPEIIEIE